MVAMGSRSNITARYNMELDLEGMGVHRFKNPHPKMMK
jgi:hypothetical protein